jgi:hypothetical protein
MRGAYRVLVGKPEGKRQLVRPRRRWEDNIKMDLQAVGWRDMDWVDLAQNRDRWRARVSEPSGSTNAANFLTGWGEGLCSRDYLRDAIDSDSGYVASDYSVRVSTGFERCGRKVSWPIRNYYLGVCQEAMRKSRRELSLCSPCRGWSSDHALAVSVLSTGLIYLRFLLHWSEQRLLLPSVLSFPAGRSWVQIPAGARDFLSSKTVQTGYGAHAASYSKGTGFLSRG